MVIPLAADTIVAIPTIGEAPQLGPLVAQLLDEGVREVVLMINRGEASVDVAPRPRLTRVALYDLSIYAEWNRAIERARSVGASRLAILNDDIELDPGALDLLLDLMATDPQLVVVGFDCGQGGPGPGLRYCHGSYRHRGIPGFAFVVDPAVCPAVDEQFEWWGADDDLFFTTEQQGGLLAVAEGAVVHHVAETTAIRHPWTFEARARDRERFAAKWGEAAAW